MQEKKKRYLVLQNGDVFEGYALDDFTYFPLHPEGDFSLFEGEFALQDIRQQSLSSSIRSDYRPLFTFLDNPFYRLFET